MSSSLEDLRPFPFSRDLRRPSPRKMDTLSPLCVGVTKDNVHNLRSKKKECFEEAYNVYDYDSLTTDNSEALKSASSSSNDDDSSLYYLGMPPITPKKDHQLNIEGGFEPCLPPVEKPKEDSQSASSKRTEEEFPCEEFYIGEDEVLAARGEILPEELQYARKVKQKYSLLEEPSRMSSTGLPHACSDTIAHCSSNDTRAKFCYSQPHSLLAHCGKYVKEPRLVKLYSSSSNSSKQSDLADIPEEGDHYYEDSSVSASRVCRNEGFLPFSVSTSSQDKSSMEASGSDYQSCRASAELFDKKLREMLYSVNRTNRRAAVERILKDRGLECVPWVITNQKGYFLCGEGVKERKNKILNKVKKIVAAESFFGIGKHHEDSDESQSDDEVLRCLSGRSDSVASPKKVFPQKTVINADSCPLAPKLVVTPPSPPPNGVSSLPQEESDSSGPASPRSAIAKGYMAYQKVVSKATPLMKNTIISNKWEVISYLSGISSATQLLTETPEWYSAVHSLLVENGSDDLHAIDMPVELSYLC